MVKLLLILNLDNSVARLIRWRSGHLEVGGYSPNLSKKQQFEHWPSNNSQNVSYERRINKYLCNVQYRQHDLSIES